MLKCYVKVDENKNNSVLKTMFLFFLFTIVKFTPITAGKIGWYLHSEQGVRQVTFTSRLGCRLTCNFLCELGIKLLAIYCEHKECSYVKFTSWTTGIFRLPWLRFFHAFSSVVRHVPGYTSQRRGMVRTIHN